MFGDGLDQEGAQWIDKVLLAERFHWTLADIDAMDEGDYHRFHETMKAIDAAREQMKGGKK